MGKAFHDLIVWQRSMDLSIAVYRLTEGFPRSEMYGLSSQMRRAAVSVPSNIAEGAARSTRKDFRHFVVMARGSSAELQTQLILAGRLGYSTDEQIRLTYKYAARVGQMLTKLAQHLAQTLPTNPESRSQDL